ncbi:SatD family protein [Pedobacter boryungensis]|uniref:Transcriptional regulator n=1 Tax=Pedobacter boryungensis TaxID=869962 RepID=A0ABX2DB88_9SPHI|nr:SatD family protein [Pedobacter boryungensis]NQX30698.1 transcriptional regulator [Pedobacter boryungensis]
MIAVITGDIINSRALPEEWISTLKSALEGLFGKNINWEIFRGDSFQIELNAKDALINAIYIKACIKTLKKADVRIGIGIGKKSTNSTKVTEANGEAFVNSGFAFDTLKVNKVNMALKTPCKAFDANFNLLIKFALIAMDNWGPISAEMIKYAIENKNLKQDKIAKISGRSQSSVSEALKRGHYAEIIELENKYRNEVVKLIKK